MKRVWAPVALVMIAVAAMSCQKEDAVTGIVGPDSPGTNPPEADSLLLARNVPAILANGVDEVQLVAVVLDRNGRGLAEVGVRFSTDLGTIGAAATTDASGIARTTFVGVASGTDLSATVSARTTGEVEAGAPRALVVIGGPDLSAAAVRSGRAIRTGGGAPVAPGPLLQSADLLDEVAVRMLGITLRISADPEVIPANGSESTIVARVIETTSSIPIPNQLVRFGATSGSITARATTGGNGQATAILSGLEGGTASTVTVFYGTGLIASTNVSFRPLILTVTSALAQILADGRSSTTIAARLVNDEGNPVPGVQVGFATTLGLVNSPVTTDDRGLAAATLVAAEVTGTAVVQARFRNTLEAETSVVFVGPPASAALLLTVQPDLLDANGGAEATVRAVVLDAGGGPMPDGTPVAFAVTSGDGTVFPQNAITVGGIAETVYIAGRTPGTVTVRASSGLLESTTSLVQAPVEPRFLTLTTDRASLLADGLATATLTAQVTDANGGTVRSGTVVSFTTNRGTIENVSPTDRGGLATARLRAERGRTGSARVTASVGQLQQTVDVSFTSDDGIQIVLTGLERPAVAVRGTGDPETSSLVFELRDAHGIPVDASHARDLAFAIRPVGGATDASVFPATVQTNQEGQAGTTLRSGFVSGTVEVTATTGGIVSHPIRVAIHGGLPDPDHFSFSVAKVNIAGLVFDGLRNGVTARVADVWGNPVPASTVVWFRSAYGLIQGSAGTDDHGEATVWEVTGGPRPQIPGGDGLVEICLETVSRTGATLETCGSVMWSGRAILEILSPDTLDVANAGSAVITYRLSDANFNPLTEGTVVSVASNVGDLQGVTSFTLPDTQDPFYTQFSVVLLDDEPEIIEPRPVTVTVAVESQNGSAVAFLTGVIR